MKTKTYLSLDDAIRETYVEMGIGVDKVATISQNRKLFVETVIKLTNGTEDDEDAICVRLVNLRKLGQDNGGLPRLERSYHGRNQKKVNKPR